MRGLRIVFAMKNSPALLPVFDLILLVGFFMRSVLFGIAAALRPGRDYSERGAVSRRCMAEAFWALVGVEQPAGPQKAQSLPRP
jgi:hypothetical protein